jgi:two-component system, NarL family, sensor histidine kinase UhpB
MNRMESAALFESVRSDRDTVTRSWYAALASTGTIAKAADVRTCLKMLLDDAIVVLSTEPFAPKQARAIGTMLAALLDSQPTALSTTIEVLARELLAGLCAEQLSILQPRLAAVLGQLASGFLTQTQEASRQRQEWPRRVLEREHHATLAALQTSERWLHTAVNSLPVVLFAFDWAGHFTHVEGQGLHDLGFTAESILGRSVFEEQTTLPQLAEHARRVLAGETFTAVVDAGKLEFETHYAPLRNPYGLVMGAVGLAINISERTQMAALREREANYRLLIEHIPAITYIAALDEASSTLYTSPQIETILGFTQAEWMADHSLWLKQVHPDDRATVLAALARSRFGEVAPCDYRMLTRDGRVVWFRDEAALTHDQTGQPLYLYGVMLDITTHKQLEDELAEAGRRLAHTREAERLRIAHDLHDGPVQHLLGIGYHIDDSQRHLAALRCSEAQAIALALDLETIRAEVCAAAAQLRELISVLRPAGLDELGLSMTLEGYVARLRRESGPDLPAIELDLEPSMSRLPRAVAECLFRAAQEALRNALKHAKARRVTLSLRQLSDEVALMVHDDGCGFEVPERLSVLALSGCFGLIGIAEQVAWAGGQVAIHSQAGQGTTVTVCIGLRQGEGADD